MKGLSYGGRFNFDGYLVSTSQRESYVQVFRSGWIEAGVAPFLGFPKEYQNRLPSIDLEDTIITSMRNYLDVQNRLAIPLPIFVSVSLLDVRGYQMPIHGSVWQQTGQAIDRDHLLLPELLVEDYSSDIGRLARPMFDALWQSSGHEKSLNYGEDGNWRPYHITANC